MGHVYFKCWAQSCHNQAVIDPVGLHGGLGLALGPLRQPLDLQLLGGLQEGRQLLLHTDVTLGIFIDLF